MAEPSRKEAALCCASAINESHIAGWLCRLHFRWPPGHFNCNGGLWGSGRMTPAKVSGAMALGTTLSAFWNLVNNRIASLPGLRHSKHWYDEQPAEEVLLAWPDERPERKHFELKCPVSVA
jgi:hypothetical protein